MTLRNSKHRRTMQPLRELSASVNTRAFLATSSRRRHSTSGSPVTQELHCPLLGCLSSFIGSYLTHERPTRPISKAKASGWETGSTFYSRAPDRQLAHLPSEGGWLQTKAESSVRKQATALRRASTQLKTFPW